MPRGVLKVSSELREYVLDDLSQFSLETDVKKGKILDLIKGSVLNTNRFVHVIQVPDKRPDKEAIDFFIDTIKIYYYLSHPFIEKLLGFTKSYKLSIVTENSHLTLKKFLNDEKSISGTILNKIAMGIAFGMRYMHMNRYIHCKLSPHTIYLTDEKSPKISHLEISHSFDKSPSLRSIPTHLNYVAPEYMDTNSSYNEKVDVYSYGMILYEMTTGKVPCCDVPSNQLLTQIRDGKKPSLKKAPKTIKSLIEECWSNDPQSRPSFDTIFNKFKNRNVMFNKVDDKEFSRFLNEINNSIDLPIKEKPYIKYTGEYLNKKDNQRNKNDDYEYDDDDYDDDSHEKRNRNKNRNRRRNSDYESFGMHSRNKSSFTDSENSAFDDSDKYYRKKKDKRKPGPFDSPNSGYKMRTVWKGNENYQKKNRKYLSDNDISDDNHVDLNNKRNKRFIFSDDENSSDEENYQRKRKVNPFDSPVNGYKMKTVCRKDQTSYDPTVTSQKMFKKPKNTNFSMRTVFRHNSIPDPVIKRIDNDTKINSESSNDDDGDDDSIDKYVKVKKMLKKPKNKKNYIKKEVVYTSSSDDDIERIIIKKIKKKKKKMRPQQIIEIQYSSEYEEEEEKIQKIIKKIKKKKKPKLVEKEPQKTIKSPKVTKSPHNMNKKISISSSSVDSISDQIPKYQTDQEDDSNGKYVKIKTQPKIKKNYIEKNIPIIKESKPNKKMKSIFTVSDFLKPKYKNDDNIKPLNLNIIANLSHPKFEKELSEAETRLKPSQYDDFFFIIINHLKSKIDYHIIKKLLKVVILILTTEEAFDSLCKSGLILFLPYKENVINYTFKVLELLFQFRPNSFQDNFEPRMTQLIDYDPESCLKLLNFYAQSFEYIENPWPLLDLLIKNNKKFLEIENSEDYISLLLFLNSHFANYVRARLKHCRPIFIRALRSENLRCVSASYLAIATLFDSGIDLPLSQVFNDLKEPELEENVLKVISLIKQIPIKQEYIYALINSAHRYEEASKTVLQLLKLETTALILIENSKWLKYLLPTISHTLKIYQKCIQYDSVKKKLKYCKEIPYFMIMLLHSNDISCLQQLPIVIRDSNLTNLEILQENNFFEVLLQEMNERNDILPYLAILSNIASIGYTKKYLKFTTILKNSLKSKDAMISHGALHALSNLSQYKQCAGQYREQNILDIAENYCNSKEDEKYLRRLREYI